jgi:hypothetical protein
MRLFWSYIFIEVRPFMSYIQNIDAAGSLLDCEQDWIWSKKTDPRGLSLGGDREDLGPADVSLRILAL